MEPILNIISVLIFLGVAQAFFLGAFFLGGGRGPVLSNRYLGGFLIVLGCVILEMMLGYSGYMTRVIHLVDFSEPLNFLLGPLVFLSVQTRIHVSRPFQRRQLFHLVPFIFYALYHIPYMIQSAAFKHDAWVQAWRDPTAPGIGVAPTMDIDPLGLRSVVTELTVLHVLTYAFASAWLLNGALRSHGISWWRRIDGELAWLRTFLIQFLVVGLVVIGVKAAFPNDLGDHLIALCMTGIIYTTSATVMGRSAIFAGGRSGKARKYEKSALTPERRDAVVEQLKRVMDQEKPYLQPSLTLGDLASMVKVSGHHLSQVLNEAMGSTFHEYMATHRIEEAKRLLAEPENDGLRIEDIAERVGYFSKSSFNTVFRRLTDLTPSEYRRSRNA